MHIAICLIGNRKEEDEEEKSCLRKKFLNKYKELFGDSHILVDRKNLVYKLSRSENDI